MFWTIRRNLNSLQTKITDLSFGPALPRTKTTDAALTLRPPPRRVVRRSDKIKNDAFRSKQRQILIIIIIIIIIKTPGDVVPRNRCQTPSVLRVKRRVKLDAGPTPRVPGRTFISTRSGHGSGRRRTDGAVPKKRRSSDRRHLAPAGRLHVRAGGRRMSGYTAHCVR